ncbi:MAG: nucleotidyl transferase AbiEii/AbiGii toxin family protein [Vicinamibacterales bacterium]
MTVLDRAIHAITQLLESEHIEYAIVGGIANAVWGEPRATVDVDVTVSVDERAVRRTVQAIASRLRAAVADPAAFVRQTRVLPVDTEDGVRIDVIFALMPFELEAIGRARSVAMAGRQVRVVTAEDLILMKIVSDRPRDLADAEAIVRRRRSDLDLAYIEPLVGELAATLEQDDILERWRRWTSA